MARRRVRISRRREMGNVNGRARALGQFQMAGDKIGVGMSFQDGNDFEPLALRGFSMYVLSSTSRLGSTTAASPPSPIKYEA